MENINIVEYDEFRAKIDEVKEVCNFIPDVSTDDGYQKSKRVSLDVGKILTAIEKTRKEKKAYALELGRAIDSDAKKIVSELEAYQLPHKEAYKALDNHKKELEKARKAELEARVEEIRTLPELMRDSDSNGVKAALERMLAEECEDFFEFTTPALKARNASREALSKLFDQKLNQEREQAELARLRKEQAERQQEARDERIARQAAENARIEAERVAEAERKKAEDEKAAAEARAMAAQKEKEDAERRIKEQAERMEREKQEAIERERKRVEDAKAAEEAEALAREKNRTHKAKTNNQAVDCLIAGGIDKETAKKVIKLIAQKKVDGIKINY